MADQEGHANHPLIERLSGDQCVGYDFFRLVRLIQAAYPDSPPFGTSKTPEDDPIRFGQRPSLAFAPSTIAELVPGAAETPPKLYVNFFGLFGPNGPLPLHITHHALRRQLGQVAGGGEARVAQSTEPQQGATEGYKDHSMADFCDIFHHRLISLFFRAWANSQPTVDLDRGERGRFLSFVDSTWGEPSGEVDGVTGVAEDPVSVRARAFYAGRLSSPARNAEGLERMLQDFFGIPTVIEELFGRWFDLPKENWTQLGRSRAAGEIGDSLILGARTWAAHLSFRIRMGPMTLAELKRMLPREEGFRRLKSWIVNYLGTEFVWDLQLVLKADEVPDTIMGEAGLLGWTTWLKSGVVVQDSDQLVLSDHSLEG